MDIQALFALAAYCCKNGKKELAMQVLEQACACEDFDTTFTKSVQTSYPAAIPQGTAGMDTGGTDGFDSYVDDVAVLPPTNLQVGGAPVSENTLSPSLHGADNMSLGQAIAIASAVSAHKRFLEHGETLCVDPRLLATASAPLDPYDDDLLVRKQPDVTQLQPGRIKIKI